MLPDPPHGLEVELRHDGVLVVAPGWLLTWRFDINDRWVQIEAPPLGGPKRTRILLEDLERVYVAAPRQDYSGHFLVLKGKETVRAAEGCSIAQLEWIRDAIGEAVETRRRREAVEGREWGFQKKAPDEIKDLVDRS